MVLRARATCASTPPHRRRPLGALRGRPQLDDTEAAQHLYALLRREKPHHPNLLAALIASAWLACAAPRARAAAGAPRGRRRRRDSRACQTGGRGSPRCAASAVILVSLQWKAMVRGTRAALRGVDGVRVLLLDGNVAQRHRRRRVPARGRRPAAVPRGVHRGAPPAARAARRVRARARGRHRVRAPPRRGDRRSARPDAEGEVRVYSYVRRVVGAEEAALWREAQNGPP